MIKTVSIKAIPFYSRKKVSIKICDRAYIISPAPKVPVPILVLQASIPLEYDHCTLAFQVSHER